MSRRPLIALDALLVRANPTGVGRSILELTAALAARDRGLDFVLLASEPALFGQLAGRPGWSVEACPGARGGTLRKAWFTQRDLPRRCRRLGVDLLHSLQFVAPLRLACPSVVTVHDLAWQDFPGTVEQPRRAYYGAFVPPSLRRAAAVVANSRATAADVARWYPEVAARVAVTAFATPSWVWQQPSAPPPPPAERPAFLFVGTLEPRKNLEGIVAAYTRFLERAEAAGRPAGEIPDLQLVGGRGWKDSALRRRMQPLAARGRLHLLDYCGPAELWRRYRLARALLFPSLHEGFGFPILEAMAAELPVLTSDRGAMAEVAGDAALLVDPTDCEDLTRGLERLAWDHDLRRDLIARGRERARAWNWETTAEATCAVYRRILSGK